MQLTDAEKPKQALDAICHEPHAVDYVTSDEINQPPAGTHANRCLPRTEESADRQLEDQNALDPR